MNKFRVISHEDHLAIREDAVGDIIALPLMLTRIKAQEIADRMNKAYREGRRDALVDAAHESMKLANMEVYRQGELTPSDIPEELL